MRARLCLHDYKIVEKNFDIMSPTTNRFNHKSALYACFILYSLKWRVLHRSYKPKFIVTHPILASDFYRASSIDYNGCEWMSAITRQG